MKTRKAPMHWDRKNPQLTDVQPDHVGPGDAASHADPIAGLPPTRNIYRAARLLIKSAAFGLVATFAWLQLKGESFVPVAQSLSGGLVLRLTLALYYTCWVAGVLRDTKVQERAYVTQPNEGRIPLGGYLGALALSLLFGALCWWADTYTKFALFLGGFLIVNIATWRYLVSWVLPETLTVSRAALAGNWVRLEELEFIYRRYLSGQWQWARFGAGGAIVVIINAFAYLGVPSAVTSRFTGISSDLFMAGMILMFVLLMEGWIWWVRLRLQVALDVLKYIGQSYTGSLTKR